MFTEISLYNLHYNHMRCILVSVLQRNRTECVYIEKETYFKELAHVIMRAW